MISRIDHISLAVNDFQGAQSFFSKLLGIIPGASATDEKLGFIWQIFSAGDLSRLELIAPSGDNSFLQSFLAEKADGGIHHITFETPDIKEARENLEHHQIPYFGYNDGNQAWKELFIHPRDAYGVLIQIAEFSPGEWIDPSLNLPKGVKWSVEKTDGGGTLTLAHPGGGKASMELTRQELKQLVTDLSSLL